MAGGNGSRLWPVSNINHPKFFIKINDELSLLQETYLRAKNLDSVSGITTVANHKFISRISNEYYKADHFVNRFVKNSFISEPMPRNTAAAITIAALQIEKLYGLDEVMLVLPSDHLIKDKVRFEDSVDRAINHVEKDKIVVFGIEPSHAETGYGYIKYSGDNVEKFIEKPDIKAAEEFVQSKEYLWNSGIFCFKAGCFLKEMTKHSSEIIEEARHCISLSKLSNSNDYIELKLDSDSFASIKEGAVDYELLEKSQNLAVVPSVFDWKDVGNWESLCLHYSSDINGNRINGSAKLKDAKNCYIENSGKNITVIGVKDLTIINSDAGVLVADRSRVSEVKDLFCEKAIKEYQNFTWGKVKEFSKNNGPNITQFTISSRCGFRIKDYFESSANWLVVNGSVEFSSDESVTILSDNESKYISPDMDAYITNVGSAPLIILSIQVDDYMLENGIIRLENSFGQMKNGKVTVL